MDIKRRQFLKIAGLSTIAGLGAPAAFNEHGNAQIFTTICCVLTIWGLPLASVS